MKSISFFSKYRVLVIIFLGCSVISILTTLVLAYIGVKNVKDGLLLELNNQAAVTADNTAAALLFDDTRQATSTLNKLSESSDITKACLYNADGKIFSYYTLNQIPSCPDTVNGFGTANIIKKDITSSYDDVGTLVFEYSTNRVASFLNDYLVFGGTSILLILALCGALLCTSLYKKYIRPIEALMVKKDCLKLHPDLEGKDLFLCIRELVDQSIAHILRIENHHALFVNSANQVANMLEETSIIINTSMHYHIMDNGIENNKAQKKDPNISVTSIALDKINNLQVMISSAKRVLESLDPLLKEKPTKNHLKNIINEVSQSKRYTTTQKSLFVSTTLKQNTNDMLECNSCCLFNVLKHTIELLLTYAPKSGNFMLDVTYDNNNSLSFSLKDLDTNKKLKITGMLDSGNIGIYEHHFYLDLFLNIMGYQKYIADNYTIVYCKKDISIDTGLALPFDIKSFESAYEYKEPLSRQLSPLVH